MATVTTKTKAWLTKYSATTPQQLAAGKTDGLIYSDADMTSEGWSVVGEAEITVTLFSHDQLIANKVDALRAEAKSVRAAATARVTQIESQIQNLLAISFDGAVQ